MRHSATSGGTTFGSRHQLRQQLLDGAKHEQRLRIDAEVVLGQNASMCMSI
jgi:hypothetical protein